MNQETRSREGMKPRPSGRGDVTLFIGSWAGQAWAMQPVIEKEGWIEFWAATFENWESEWLQLIFQAILLLGAKHWLFQADARDLERIEEKIDRLLGRKPEKARRQDAP